MRTKYVLGKWFHRCRGKYRSHFPATLRPSFNEATASVPLTLRLLLLEVGLSYSLRLRYERRMFDPNMNDEVSASTCRAYSPCESLLL